jgi:hypothetical protein
METWLETRHLWLSKLYSQDTQSAKKLQISCSVSQIYFMFSQSNYTCKFQHLKIVTFYNSWYLKVALSVGEVAKFEVSTVASLESFKGVGCHPI